MRSPLSFSCVVLSTLVISAHTASADLLVAENELTTIGSGLAVYTDLYRAQSFTATDSGTLSTIELQIWRDPDGSPTDDLFIDVTTLSGGLPDESNVLATQSLASGAVDTDEFGTNFTAVDFSSSSVDLTSGEMYAIVLRSSTGTSPDWYLWGAADTNPYSDGTGFFSFNPDTNPFVESANVDFGFRVSVSEQAVPEPSSFALLTLTGLLGLTRLRRKQQVSAETR